MKLVKSISDQSGTHAGWLAWCEPCGTHKRFDKRWTFNGNEERPTFEPSMLLRGFGNGPVRPEGYVCHSFLRDGVWQYLGDCTHELAGQNVPMTLPKWGEEAEHEGSSENATGGAVLRVPVAAVPMGGPSLPAPAWFEDGGVPWLRCGGCGDLLNLRQLADETGLCSFGVTHPRCGTSLAPFQLEGWRKP